MTTAQIQAIMIFSAVIIGLISAGYMYQTVVGIFMPALRKALRHIALGLLSFTFGVLLAALIIYSAELGVSVIIAPYESILSAGFYVLYIIGAVLVMIGSRQFALRPAKPTADVSLGQVG